MAWPKTIGTVDFNGNDDDHFLIVGNVLRLHDGIQFDANTDTFVTISVVAMHNSGLPLGFNTNFRMQVVRVDHPPTSIFFDGTDGISENQSNSAEPGVEIGAVSTADPDENESFRYFVDDSRFQVKGDATGFHLYLKPGLTLDFEQEASIPINITAVDKGGLDITRTFIVKVNNVFEKPTAIVGGNGSIVADLDGAPVGVLSTIDPDSDPTTQSFRYSVSDQRFEVAADGLLKLKAGQKLSATEPPITVAVTATDVTNLSVVQSFKVAVSPVIQLSAARYEVTEGQATLVITVSRTGDSSGAVTADYTIGAAASLPLRNQASLDKDIQAALSARVSFAADESMKTIAIGLTNDNLVEDDESLELGLSNPTGGATLRSQAGASIVIKDNDLPSVPSEQPAAKRLELAGSGFGKSAEHYRDFVFKAYARFLNRSPDSAGLTYWVTLMQQYETSKHASGLRQQQIEAGFIASPEYESLYGGVGEAWIRGIYKDLLGRAADENGVRYWLG